MTKRHISIDCGCFRKYGNIKEIIKLLKEVGFTAYDASMFTGGILDELIFSENWKEEVKELRKYADSIGIVCNQSHAPFQSAKVNNPEYNEWVFPRLVRAIQVSGILGAKVCVVHPCNDWNAYENSQLYKKLEPIAREYNVKIGLENMWNCIGWNTPEFKVLPAACSHHDDFKAHLDLLPEDVFVGCLDFGHAELIGLNTSCVQMIETLKDRLQAVHIHDVDLKNDSHQIPYTQRIQWEKAINALKQNNYKGDITLETSDAIRGLPKELIPHVARYLAMIAKYFKDQLDY